MSEYLRRLQRGGKVPNFWCSEEYFRRAGLREVLKSEVLGVFDEELLVLPPLTVEGGFCWPVDFPDEIWSDVVGFVPGDGAAVEPEFLDLEYVYNPEAFTNLAGNRWATFRKNSRKFPRRLEGRTLDYGDPTEGDRPVLEGLLMIWLESKGESAGIHDGELMLDYALYGDHRKVLRDSAGQLWGVNAWDENFCYINFRFCVCVPELFLSEYMRLLFFTDPLIQAAGKLVNDGGVLDSAQLQFFKDKLNPLRVRRVNTWRRSVAKANP